MSLNSLPDEIIAKISKRMPGQDRCNLMATNKRCGKIWKAYKMDYKYGIIEKMKVEHKYFGPPSHVTIQLTRAHRASLNGRMKTYQQFGRIMGEIRQIGILELERVEITIEFVKELQKRKCKLQEIRFTKLSVFNLSKADFLTLTSFGQKLFFDNVRFEPCRSYAMMEIRDNKPICIHINPEPRIIEDRLTEAEFFSNELAHSENRNNISYQLGLCNVNCKDKAKKRATEFAASLAYQIVITDEGADEPEEIEGAEYGPYFYIQLTTLNQAKQTFSFTI